MGVVAFLDVSRPSLVEAMAAADGPSAFLLAEASRLPLTDACIDAVVIRSVLIYLKGKVAAARELARVLRSGGRVALFEPINRRMDPIIDFSGFDDIAEAYARAKGLSPLTDFDERDLVAAFESAGFAVDLTMDESRWPARGKEWAHGFRHGAPPGYSAYDMMLTAGIARERVNEFIAAGERQLGEEWRIMSCPAAYILAVKQASPPHDKETRQ